MPLISRTCAVPQHVKPPRRFDLGQAEDDPGLASLRGIADAIGREVDADGVLVAWHDGDAEPIVAFASGSCASGGDTEHDALVAASRAFALPLATGQDGEHMRCIDGEAEHALTIRVRVARSTVTLTTICRDLGSSGRARCRAVLARMSPILDAFFRIWDLRADALARSRRLRGAIDRSNVATLLVDRFGKVQFANPVALDLLGRGDGIRLNGNVLSATRLSETMRLQAVLAHLSNVDEHDPEPMSAPVIAFRRAQGRPLLAAFVANDASIGDADEGGAIVYIFDPEQDLRPLIEPACRLYRLSPVEARLACLIADGKSLADAAEAMRVREQTARSYLKQIFLKTDTNRQAELVWLLLKSSVHTAPDCHASFV